MCTADQTCLHSPVRVFVHSPVLEVGTVLHTVVRHCLLPLFLDAGPPGLGSVKPLNEEPVNKLDVSCGEINESMIVEQMVFKSNIKLMLF